MNEYQQKIETLLFYRNEPVSFQWLSRHLGISVSNTKDEVQTMLDCYADRGIELVIADDTVSLVSNRKQYQLIEKIKEQDVAKELSKQALETLAIIVYKKQVTKSEIDFIRGVNSVYILRNLMVRGLIDKKTNPLDKRSPLYIPTLDLFSFLGINQVSDLDGYDEYAKKLEGVHAQYLKEVQEEDNSQDGTHQEENQEAGNFGLTGENNKINKL